MWRATRASASTPTPTRPASEDTFAIRWGPVVKSGSAADPNDEAAFRVGTGSRCHALGVDLPGLRA
jgi:hypothetical protein